MGGGGQPCPLPLCNAPWRHRTTPVQCRGNENKSLIGSVRLGILPLNGCHSLKWVWPGGLIKGGEGGVPSQIFYSDIVVVLTYKTIYYISRSCSRCRFSVLVGLDNAIKVWDIAIQMPNQHKHWKKGFFSFNYFKSSFPKTMLTDFFV